MKNPRLAAGLNIIPGIGYIYVDAKSFFGWMLLLSGLLSCVMFFDPAYMEYLKAPLPGYVAIIGTLALLLLLAAFVIDGYERAVAHNASVKKTK